MRLTGVRFQGLLVPILLAALIAGCGDSGNGPDGGGGGGGGGAPQPTRTAAGTPTGSPTSQSIGPAGGTLTFPGGAVTLTVPAGALTSSTDLSIQQVTAMAPGGAATAWRMLPDGLQFSSPVTLTFHYDDDMMRGSAPELSWIAYQEATGAWRYVDEVVLDKAARTITVQTTHFTDWTLVSGLQLRPATAEVDPGGSVDLEVKNCMTEVDGPIYAYECVTFDFGDEDDLPALPSRNNPQGAVDVGSWAVNGNVGGSGIDGQVFGSATPGTLGTAEYRAPGEPPDNNPVAVSVDIRDGQNRKVATLVSNIRIKGDFPTIHVLGELERSEFPIAILLGADVTDKVEFDIKVIPDGSLEVSNIQNFSSGYTNAHLPPGGESSFCRFTIDSPFEAGTYTEISGGGSSLDSVIVSVDGTGTMAASTYYAPDSEGACVYAAPYPGSTVNLVRSLFEFDRTLFDHVGADVIVLGFDGDPTNYDGWTYSLRRIR